MRHSVYRLATEGARQFELRASGRRSWRRTVVVPREACIFEQVSCSGIAWHERRNFAHLQALRLAPFASTGASATVRAGRLLLWLWDKDEVDSAISARGFDPASVRTIAESLLLPVPTRSGTLDLPTQGGIDHLALDRGAIVSSRWEAVRAGRSIAAPDLLSRPWSGDLLQARWYSSRDGIDSRRYAIVASWLVAALSAVYFAYWAGSFLSLQHQLEARQRAPATDNSEFAAIARTKAGERADFAWLQNYRRLTASLQIEALLNALAKPLEANRIVIKDLEARNNDLRLTVASVDNDIDLPRVLLTLQGVPGIETVQLRQNADTLQATYTMRLGRFVQPVFPPGATP